jgi:hypothetical protein
LALYLKTSEPEKVMQAFKASVGDIDQPHDGARWLRPKDSEYITHADPEWAYKSWVLPSVRQGALLFNIIRPEDRYVSVKAYAAYHAELVGTLMDAGLAQPLDIKMSSRCADGDLNA